ncbi:MAG: hypothetical protein NTX22_02440 [Ignavibacteriales bacterium]|nr:hypothetical protein [Ignavibacteriales bacterium]
MKYFLSLCLSTLLMIFSINCKDTVTNEDLDKKIIPDKNVSYIQHIQPVFDLKCNTANCHSSETRAGGLSFTSYQNTTSDLSIVFPGQPQNSRLINSIEGPSSSSYPMPPIGYPPLTKNQIAGITTWVKEGALNN